MHRRRAGLKKSGTTPEEYDALWDVQGGKCANSGCSTILSKDGVGTVGRLHADHDHKSGRLRGLLCPGCNLALGCVLEDRERLRGLLEYLG